MRRTFQSIAGCLSGCGCATATRGVTDSVSDCLKPRDIRKMDAGTHCGQQSMQYNTCPAMPPQPVRLHIQDHHVVLDNGIVQVTLSKPGGIVTGIRYNGIDNLLEFRNKEDNRGYWDLDWSPPGGHGIFDVIKGTIFRVVVEHEEQVELSFLRMWDFSLEGKYIPLNIDKRFIMLRGSSGFYSYAIYEHLQEWPEFSLGQTRFTFKLRKEKFRYMAMADNRQRHMPLPEDRSTGRGQPLAYPEAVLLVNPTDSVCKGEVDDKYQYSCENKDLKVHGWICYGPPVGFWLIIPSDEFRSCGPVKQNLTSHVGPTTLAVFLSSHYAGKDINSNVGSNEPWKKVFGPVFIYLNSAANGDDPLWLWEDAKIQMMSEVQSWPYSFPASEDFQKSEHRGRVSGRLLVRDRYVSNDYISANGAYVGLAPPGDVGSWQTEWKEYQFWTTADEDGYFSIKHIRTGNYNLYAWVPGFIGDYRYDAVVTITAGWDIEMGDLVYEPPRDGPTLWEIGIPDRSAGEFYIPDPDPIFRQYGLWSRYAEMYPDEDLVYTIGVSDYTKDWFFAHVVRKVDSTTYQGTTWQIKFKLDTVDKSSTYKLRVAIASATLAELQIRVNDPHANRPLFTTGLVGRDNAIARHGIHGLYRLYHVNIPNTRFIEGENTIFLKQPSLITNMPSLGVQLHVQDSHVMMDNGILQVTLSNPEGIVTGIRYNDIDNLLEVLNDESNRGIKGTSFNVIVETDDQVEISFSRTWDSSQEGKLVPLNIDKRFVMLRGSSGFYSYAIYEHLEEWPAFNLAETRIAFKLRKDKFHYMAVADNRQRYMPLPDDRLPPRGQPLAYPEAVLLVNPVEPELKGEVDDKYQYSCDNKDIRVHGWICTDPGVGFWLITPSDEFKSGGPQKQNLTSHVGPTTLSVFVSAHYSGEDLVPKFNAGEQWKKVFGPVFIYCNSSFLGDIVDPLLLWEDAKQQMSIEVESWPYCFPASEDFPKSDQRGNVSGRLLVRDKYVSDDYISADGAYVGLAPQGAVGSWQRECKDYQFWSRADENGYFSINDIRTGNYNLFAWVPGFIGDYRYEDVVNITPGCDIDTGNIVYEPPRNGPTLWEIGIPDRSAAEFYVPDPNPKYINKLYVDHPDRFRQYGLWERYAELYPDGDLVYTVGQSDYTKDWFFVQVTRKKDKAYQGTTWEIKFKLDSVDQSSSYKLRVAIASATFSELQVRINDPKANRALFSSGLIGRDNSIARHGIHGLYWLFNVDVPASTLVSGDNSIFFTQPRSTSPFLGIMYDYIRFEAPPSSS
ncbi:hypothetical protein JRO89_XS07G0107000 [Xanthoceras sorbifolium]|uniref:rhamnogalacturonan endolyase n=1 Tax=Xanthoceras sorbifolium TaxID=99658 RepID=A0ABQ8HTL7_9ROSI|nr:hypothetical protein JRO89_XS07G0107000 [Xanthoceras sorbifolium]